MPASRAVWIIANGDPGKDVLVLHNCNGGSGSHGCINIRHLRPGDHAKNMVDKVNGGHSLRGEAHNLAKLTDDDVCEIRRSYAPGRPWHPGNGDELAAKYGVCRSTISDIALRKTRGWLVCG